MVDSTVGVLQAATPDRLIDNERVVTTQGTVDRQRIQLGGLSPALIIRIFDNVATGGDSPQYKLLYHCFATPGTTLILQRWKVEKHFWTRIAANLYVEDTVITRSDQKLVTAGTDARPWTAVKTYLDLQTFEIT